MTKVRLWSIGVAVLMLVGPACARDEAPEATTGQQQSQPSDATITMSIQSRYFGDDTVKGHEIDVDTENGVVTLSGTVETDAARSRAETIAQGVDGVTRVQNQLRVEAAETARAADPTPTPRAGESATERTAERTGDQVNAGWITTKIQAQYFATPDVKGRNIDVTTNPDGQVTLAGEVETEAERQAAVRIARDTEGVRDVVDRLRRTADTTAAAGNRPAADRTDDDVNLGDPWITVKIESKYFLDNEVKGRNIDVTTENGIVTLEGEVETAAEKRQAVLLAQSTEGVTDVRDQLRIVAPADEREADRPAAEAVSDEWIEAKIQSKYFLATDLKNTDIEVEASKGVVTLTGQVQTAADKRTAEEIARETDGVRNVVNRIEITESGTPRIPR